MYKKTEQLYLPIYIYTLTVVMITSTSLKRQIIVFTVSVI